MGTPQPQPLAPPLTPTRTPCKQDEDPGIEVQLRDVTFNVAPGELVIISGVVGAGKTTLLDSILGGWAA